MRIERLGLGDLADDEDARRRLRQDRPGRQNAGRRKPAGYSRCMEEFSHYRLPDGSVVR
jgi:hypothetical protein